MFTLFCLILQTKTLTFKINWIMKTKISILIDEFKRTSSLDKWIEIEKEKARVQAYDNRSVIYKRELENEVRKLNYIIPLWSMFKKLRKKSTDYDVLIEVDRKGYITLQVTFPITQKEVDLAWENKRNWNAANKGFECCCRITEEIYKASHTRVEKVLKGIELSSNGSYERYGDNKFVRWCDISSVKC